jgi:hypothetical protein
VRRPATGETGAEEVSRPELVVGEMGETGAEEVSRPELVVGVTEKRRVGFCVC